MKKPRLHADSLPLRYASQKIPSVYIANFDFSTFQQLASVVKKSPLKA